ncbi:uncharacterized protein LOC135499946 [Lineus longissimus]|uniref:uncharacterized protein LOC135499946 n=1 Tax=Lineus longissimus TaxID=88925 RepID=UPI00315D37DC
MKDIDLDKDNLPLERALGVQWDPESDKFGFKTIDKDKPPTRRGILSVTSSVYDPIGFLSPFILKAKLILQDLCRLGIDWDDDIPEEHMAKWQRWLSDLPKVSNFKTDRCVKPKDFNNVVSSQLVHFSDSSEAGYGVVSYLRLVNGDGRIHCCLLLSKSRVALLKHISIPRMELTAATVAVRVDRMLRKELDLTLDKSIFFTDSTAVIKYIRNKGTRFKTFVANRLKIIHDGSDASQWCYIDTKCNPADHASRGLWADAFLNCSSWSNGLEFLWKPMEEWPTYPSVIANLVGANNVDDLEIKCAAVGAVISVDIEDSASETVRKLINHYSSWSGLKRGVALILRVRGELLRRSRVRKQNLDVQRHDVTCSPLTVDDLRKAEKAILVFSQRETFCEEIKCLEEGSGNVVKRASTLYQLDPFLEDSLVRVGGRLSNSAMPRKAKHPVILPKNCHVSQLILQDIHRNLLHSGRNHMIAKLRQRFWITNANSAARKVISDCVTCRRHRSKVIEQKMADLPEPPFSRTGVDYFGPIEVKRGRSTVKRYGVLFTCLTVRAVHLELADSLDTDSCINAIRRFIARRGQVVKLRSDNGTNFVASEKELKLAFRSIDQSRIQQMLAKQGIVREFNTPYAPHQGGIWERQVQTVKRKLKVILKEQSVSDEGLRTLLCEVEAVVNDRPLTRASSDPSDLEVLTPNHLLLLKSQPYLPVGTFDKNDLYTRRRWRQVQFLADLFWKRWIQEYLPLLQTRQKWLTPRRNVVPGDICLIVDQSSPRGAWPMAKIVETFPDKRGFVRRVRLRTATGTVLDRPVHKLCLLLEMDEPQQD